MLSNDERCDDCLHLYSEHKGNRGDQLGGACGSSAHTEKERFGGMDWCTCKGFVTVKKEYKDGVRQDK